MTPHEPRAGDLRIDARFVIPVEPAGTLIDHALVVDAGRIAALVPFATADRDYAPREFVMITSPVTLACCYTIDLTSSSGCRALRTKTIPMI